VGTSQYGSLSPGYVFQSAPQLGENSDVNLIAYGDMGDTTSAEQVQFLIRELIAYRGATLVLHAGDITYANGYQVGSCFCSSLFFVRIVF
jgi:hypothetical protein